MASRLYAASYAGKVTSLNLAGSGESHQLTTLSETTDCGTSPSWLMLDRENDFLYCLDEGIDRPNSTLSSFKLNADGSFRKVKKLQTLMGPVASAFYTPVQQPDQRFFAVAHYSGSAVTTYSVDPASGHFNRTQSFTFTMPAPGPVPERQDAPHPHGVVVDPSGQFILVPDLGADLVRIFRICPTTGHLEENQPLVVAPGSGPRHAVFWISRKEGRIQPKNVRFYLVTELDNSLRGYDVTYSNNGTILFSKFYEGSTYGGSTPPAGSKAAEIAISPGNDRVVISNRNDNIFGTGNDSIAIFSLNNQAQTSATSFVGLYPSFGSFPRQFDINTEEGMVAIAQQNSHKISVVKWSEVTDTIGSLLAEKEFDGEIPAVVWAF
ncbi:Lactonase, 7-bladed beta-propeller-domain-containing protein [Aspergillus pseudonomiae]|uniref:Lactonase, 7-bladed beta-propeller-domain-containing protein n=1 Tax=Aspergillus pseudonomiae TaxID=1506151 RepID=A0A5N6HL52_9EURO|nr:Lactonase, 7-bladed beta-propeller-domain-containing protein [Aspergillus pseudonomiae]KAB8254497.1 Lactonase, 7-bladed beta-propeller-domain-containing protein [Aspergillus pseudonomiae]KAE8397723.1 Lactonase, 7-bladed beta-propeller-domain-containing protein [Aspergillus pseudonomiae]